MPGRTWLPHRGSRFTRSQRVDRRPPIEVVVDHLVLEEPLADRRVDSSENDLHRLERVPDLCTIQDGFEVRDPVAELVERSDVPGELQEVM